VNRAKRLPSATHLPLPDTNMQPNARDAYLETQVLTASPYKLRLMLIEGAARYAQQTRQLWDESRFEDATESLIRAREIVCELMSSLNPAQSPLARQILPIYSFLFRTMTEAQLHKCREKLADVLRVLGEERETWRQLSERFAGDDDARAPLPPREIPAPTMLAPPPSTTSFSFEA
jgi:flagellar protein FliS